MSCLAQDQALPVIPPDWRHMWIGRGVCPVSAPVSTSSLLGIVHYQSKVIGHCHGTLSNKDWFHSGELWFSREFIFQRKRLSCMQPPFHVHKRGVYYKQISSPSFASAGVIWHDMKQLERGRKNYCIIQKWIQLCCGVPAPKGTKSISLKLSFLQL